jgi:hypothetical protein
MYGSKKIYMKRIRIGALPNHVLAEDSGAEGRQRQSRLASPEDTLLARL